MAKISKKKLTSELKTESSRLLLKKINEIKSVNDVEKFFDMFFTSTEKDTIIKRLAVTILLNRGEKYRKIQNSLEISKATISKIKQILSGHGYGRDLSKRVYSVIKRKEKHHSLFPPYKGAQSII